jgi:hypothetical protein
MSQRFINAVKRRDHGEKDMEMTTARKNKTKKYAVAGLESRRNRQLFCSGKTTALKMEPAHRNSVAIVN